MKLKSTFPEAQFSCLTDNPDALGQLSNASEAAGEISRVYIDIDCGMHRTGCPPENVDTLIEFAENLGGVQIAGLHGYDGHLHDHSLEVRTAKAEKVEEIITNLTKGRDFELVVGGSPTFPIHAKHPELTLSPGTTVL
jgi:D-serine deaminase-like pyridoxal phosphate-dependent protein